MLLFLLVVAVAAAVSWWSWHGRLGSTLARAAFAARATGFAALLLLVVDPGVARPGGGLRRLVLVDHSISMYAAQGRAVEAARLAATLGDTVAFGELAPGEPGGESALSDVLAAAAGGRAVTVVTDGEVPDAAAIPADLLARVDVRVLARSPGADVALTEIAGPARLAVGDTLTLDVAARRTPEAADSAAVVVRDSTTVLLRGVIHFGPGLSARIRLSGPLPRSVRGERWLRIERVGASDAEPADDARWWRLIVTPTPGIVVVAETPDWDSRALYRTLKDVADVPVRGFVQLQPGAWRRMEDLSPVAAPAVAEAAQHADLLAVRGDGAAWRSLGRSRLLWPTSTVAGDWYVAGSGVSPLAGAFAGVEPDSLPAAVGVHPVAVDSAHGWIGAVARLARRGGTMPVVGGVEERSGRTVTVGVSGLYRWGMRGGMADQAWRTMIADATAWLLATAEGGRASVRLASPVTQRGRAVAFHWSGAGAPVPVPIHIDGPGGNRVDTLQFDGAGDATVRLGVGRYRYTLDGGVSGTFAVEPYSDELVPAPVTLRDHRATIVPSAPRRSLRDLLWLFGVALAGFGTEWLLRRRLGLR